METSGCLQLPGARWETEMFLRERDRGVLAGKPHAERFRDHEDDMKRHEGDTFYWQPSGGESIANLCLRVERVLSNLADTHPGQRVVIVTHGGVIKAIRALIEQSRGTDFHSLMNQDKINNCQIIHYTRRDPTTGYISSKYSFVRSVCPWDLHRGDLNWRSVQRSAYSNNELLTAICAVPQLVNEPLTGADLIQINDDWIRERKPSRSEVSLKDSAMEKDQILVDEEEGNDYVESDEVLMSDDSCAEGDCVISDVQMNNGLNNDVDDFTSHSFKERYPAEIDDRDILSLTTDRVEKEIHLDQENMGDDEGEKDVITHLLGLHVDNKNNNNNSANLSSSNVSPPCTDEYSAHPNFQTQEGCTHTNPTKSNLRQQILSKNITIKNNINHNESSRKIFVQTSFPPHIQTSCLPISTPLTPPALSSPLSPTALALHHAHPLRLLQETAVHDPLIRLQVTHLEAHPSLIVPPDLLLHHYLHRQVPSQRLTVLGPSLALAAHHARQETVTLSLASELLNTHLQVDVHTAAESAVAALPPARSFFTRPPRQAGKKSKVERMYLPRRVLASMGLLELPSTVGKGFNLKEVETSLHLVNETGLASLMELTGDEMPALTAIPVCSAQVAAAAASPLVSALVAGIGQDYLIDKYNNIMLNNSSLNNNNYYSHITSDDIGATTLQSQAASPAVTGLAPLHAGVTTADSESLGYFDGVRADARKVTARSLGALVDGIPFNSVPRGITSPDLINSFAVNGGLLHQNRGRFGNRWKLGVPLHAIHQTPSLPVALPTTRRAVEFANTNINYNHINNNNNDNNTTFHQSNSMMNGRVASSIPQVFDACVNGQQINEVNTKMNNENKYNDNDILLNEKKNATMQIKVGAVPYKTLSLSSPPLSPPRPTSKVRLHKDVELQAKRNLKNSHFHTRHNNNTENSSNNIILLARRPHDSLSLTQTNHKVLCLNFEHNDVDDCDEVFPNDNIQPTLDSNSSSRHDLGDKHHSVLGTVSIVENDIFDENKTRNHVRKNLENHEISSYNMNLDVSSISNSRVNNDHVHHLKTLTQIRQCESEECNSSSIRSRLLATGSSSFIANDNISVSQIYNLGGQNNTQTNTNNGNLSNRGVNFVLKSIVELPMPDSILASKLDQINFQQQQQQLNSVNIPQGL